MANNTPIKDWFKQCESLREQLAASQAREQQLREVIEWIQNRCAGDAMPNWENTPHTGYSRGWILDRTNFALSIPSDASALEEYVKKAGEVMRERCAKVCDKGADCVANDMWTQGYKSASISHAFTIRALPGVTLEDL